MSAPRRAPRKAAPKALVAPRSRLEVDERRAQLVALGAELFGTRSYDDVSIDEIAQAAGISKGLLYHYFPTKRDFYVATVAQAAGILLEVTTAPDHEVPLEQLRAGIDAYLTYVERHGQAYTALLRGGIGFDRAVAQIVDRTREDFCEKLIAGLPLEVNSAILRTTLRGWIGFVEATSLEWVERRGVTREELRELLVAVLLQSVQIASGGAYTPTLA